MRASGLSGDVLYPLAQDPLAKGPLAKGPLAQPHGSQDCNPKPKP